MEANKTILQMKYARIVSIFAEQTGITLEDALNFFYTSSIYQMMNEGIADMHCRSDGYLANLVKEEWKNKKVQQNQLIMQNNSVLERSYINDFHRQSSLAALKGEQYMLLHPYSREQKLAQINSLRQNTVSKENSNLERSKKNAQKAGRKRQDAGQMTLASTTIDIKIAKAARFIMQLLLFPFYLVYSLAGNSLLILRFFFISPRSNYPLPSRNPSHST